MIHAAFLSVHALCVCEQIERPASPVSQLPPVPPRLDLLQQRPPSSHSALAQGAAAKVCVCVGVNVRKDTRVQIFDTASLHGLI